MINEFSKVAGYEVVTQKSVAFLYINNEISEMECKKCNLLELHRKGKNNFLNKPEVHLVKAMDFPVVMYGCVSWTIKKV